MAKKRLLIVEDTVVQARSRGETSLAVPVHAIVTPQARDRARALGVALIVAPDIGKQSVNQPGNQSGKQVVAIGADHGGFELKGIVAQFVSAMGWQVIDVGTNSTDRCDYPDYAYAVATAVASGRVGLGIMIDGAGPGSAIVCNKVPGIRAAAACSEFHAWNARAHNNCNVLTLGSRGTGVEVCKRIVDVFLSTPFEEADTQPVSKRLRMLRTDIRPAEPVFDERLTVRGWTGPHPSLACNSPRFPLLKSQHYACETLRRHCDRNRARWL